MKRLRLKFLATLMLLLCVATAKAVSYATLPADLKWKMVELSGGSMFNFSTIEEIEFKTGSFLTPGTLISNEDSPIYATYDSSQKKITLYTDAQAYMMNNGVYFNNFYSLIKIVNLNAVNTANMTNMGSMFKGCWSLTSLDVSNFNTQNVTDMSSMFYECFSLTSLDVSNFNTQKVTGMSSMFYNCKGLKSLDVSNFNTQNVTDMSSMFYECSSLTSLDVSNFNTQNVTSMDEMFYNCSSLTSLNVRNFRTHKVTDMSSMFVGCSSLTSLDVSNFNTQNVTRMSYMFGNCSSLTSLDVSNFNTQKVTGMSSMFVGCSSLTSLDVSNFNTQNVTNMNWMFKDCSSLTTLDVSSFNTQNVTNMSYMFRCCFSLTSLDISNFNTENVTDMSYMFNGSYSLTSLDLSNFNTQNVTDMNWMFCGCTSLTSLDVSSFNTENVKDMSYMFYNCYYLTSLDISNFNTENVTNTRNMFVLCGSLKSISVGSTIFTPTNSSLNSDVIVFCPENSISSYESNSFWGQYLIVDRISSTSDAVLPRRSHQIMEWVAGNTSIEEVRFQTSSLQTSGIKISFGSYPIYIDCNADNNTVTFYTPATKFVALEKFTWKDNNNTERSGLFADFADLKKITNLNALDTRNMTSMSDMFYDCRSLTSLDISNWNTQNVTDMGDMFYNCSSLKYLNICPNLSITGTLSSNAIVTCPENTYETYANDSFFGQYQVVKLKPTVGGQFGDVNNDTDKDVQDLYYVAKGIMAQKDANIYFMPADINQDKELTAADYVGVTNIILGRNYAAAAKGANKLEDTQYSDDILSATVSDGAMSIALDNMRDYTAMQMDVTLPEGAAIQKAVRSDRLTASHNVTVSQLADNKWRVLLTSAQNATMKGYNGELFCLTLNGAESAKTATIDNIQLVEPTMATQYLAAMEVTNEVTGVTDVHTESSTEGEVNGIDGIRHNSLKGVKSGVYVRDNKKVMVK